MCSKDNTVAKTLYIIGNGFDLAHSIKSKYSDYKSFYLSYKNNTRTSIVEPGTKPKEVEPIQTGLDPELFFEKLEGDWSNIEEAIGKYIVESICEIIELDEDDNEDGNEDVDVDIENLLEKDHRKAARLEYFFKNTINALRTLFKKWVDQIDINVKPNKKQYPFKKDSIFLTFNYTKTLESLYGIDESRICYIHGKRKRDEEYVFGHNRYENPVVIQKHLDYIGNVDVRKEVIDIMNDFVKPYDRCLNTLKHFLGNEKINEVVVCGHSLGDVDFKYFQWLVGKIGNELPWTIDYFYEDEIDRIYKVKNDLNLTNVYVRCVNTEDEYLKVNDIEDIY